MALSPEKRAEIESRIQEMAERYEAGEELGTLSEELGTTPVVLRNELRTAGVALRPPKKKRKKKVTTVEEIEDDGAEGKPAAGAALNSPLFPKGGAEYFQIEVKRVAARPRKAGTGLLGVFDDEIDEEFIGKEGGAGRYLVLAKNTRGAVVARRVLELEPTMFGPSKPLYSLEDEDEGGGDDLVYDETPLAKQLAQTQTQLQEMTKLLVQGARDEAKMQVQAITKMSESQALRDREFYQGMLAMVQKQQPADKSDPLEMLEMMLRFKELGGDFFGGGDGKDALALAIEKTPDILAGIADVIHGSQDDEDEEGEDEGEETTEKPVPKAAASKAAAAASGKPKAKITKDMLATGLFSYMLDQGYSKKEALQKVKLALRFLPRKKTIEAKAEPVAEEKPPANGSADHAPSEAPEADA